MAPSMHSSPARILIADSQAVIRAGVRLALEEQPDMHVVAEACDATSAFTAAAAARPDVAVVELGLPGEAPVELTRRFLRLSGLHLVLLCGSNNPGVLTSVLFEGVRAVLGKNAPTASLVDAIRAVRQDGSWIPPHVQERIEAGGQEPSGWTGLTARERDVAKLVAQGLAYREVAAKLDISDHTVKNHLRRIYEKLDINSRVELAVHGSAAQGNCQS